MLVVKRNLIMKDGEVVDFNAANGVVKVVIGHNPGKDYAIQLGSFSADARYTPARGDKVRIGFSGDTNKPVFAKHITAS